VVSIVVFHRMAKIKMDDQPFFGSQLHICCAPEFETVEETREKLQERRKVIAKKTRGSLDMQHNAREIVSLLCKDFFGKLS